MLTDVNAATRGDLAAFNRLVAAHQNQLYALCYRALGHEQAAVEAVQAAVRQARRHIRDCDDGRFHPWFLRWGVRACQERLRAAPAARPQTLRVSEALKVSPGRDVQTILCQMPENLRLTIILVDVVGLSYLEAASVLGASHAQISRCVAEGRRQIMDQLPDGAPDAS